MVKYTSLYGEYVYRNYGNKFYAKSQNLIILLKRAYDKALDKYDVLVMPTLPSTAPKLPEKSMPLSGIYSYSSWVAGLLCAFRKQNKWYDHDTPPQSHK